MLLPKNALGWSSAALVIALSSASCSDEAPGDAIDTSSSSSGSVPSDDAGSSGTTGSSSGVSDAENCSGVFIFWQKDAYKETGGRSTALWPPHTTTSLEITCDDATVGQFVHGNHGSEPGQTDANGRELLDEIARIDLAGSRQRLLALLERYQGCECEPSSFLSMSSLQDDLVESLLGAFIDLVEREIDCGDEGAETAELVAALQQQDFERALEIVPSCQWPNGDTAAPLNEALRQVLADTQSSLADYHVCNNDAQLQAALLDRYQRGEEFEACDPSSAICQGPLWFFDPAQ